MSRPWTYLPSTPSGPLVVDRAFYDRLARETATRTLVDRFVVPIRSGRAWPVRAGQLCRIVTVEGPQVADFNAWHLHNPRERFWASRTKQLHRAHVTTHDRLWSTLPYLRPMATITNDTLDYGIDADGGRCHDLLGTRCDPYVTKLLTGQEFDFCCHSNLIRAIAPWRLTELDVHDVLNVFQVTGLQRRPLLHEGQPGEEGRLLRDLRRDRPPLRDLDLPRRRPLRSAVGPGSPRSDRGLPAARRRDLAARGRAPRGLAVARAGRLPGQPRNAAAGGHGPRGPQPPR